MMARGERGTREQGTGNRGSSLGRVVLRGGRVLDPSQNLDAKGDLILSEGKIEGFETAAGAKYGDDMEVVDCSGLVVKRNPASDSA